MTQTPKTSNNRKSPKLPQPQSQSQPKNITQILVQQLKSNRSSISTSILTQQINQLVNFMGNQKKTTIVPMNKCNKNESLNVNVDVNTNTSANGNKSKTKTKINPRKQLQYIQIYNIRDNNRIRYRASRKKSSNLRNTPSNTPSNTTTPSTNINDPQKAQQPTYKNQKFMFVLQESFCVNALLLAMSCNEVVDVCFGTVWSNVQQQYIVEGNTMADLYLGQNLIQQINIYKSVSRYLYNKNTDPTPNTNHKHKHNQNNTSSIYPFQTLKKLSLQLHQQSLTLQQFITAAKIVRQLLRWISATTMPNLQILQINLYGNHGRSANRTDYVQVIQNYPCVQLIVVQIYRKIKHILDNKVIISKSQNQIPLQQSGKFSQLTQLSFNPVYFLKYNSTKYSQKGEQLILSSQQQPSQQKYIRHNWHEPGLQNPYTILTPPSQHVHINQQQPHYPITKLTLIQLPSSINTPNNLLTLFNTIFPYFPKITNLKLMMSQKNGQIQENQFQLFNQLCEELQRYCPLLEYLHISHNCTSKSMESGLRNIIENLPYLSDLKVKFIAEDVDRNRYRRQWEYMKEIQWRRLHLQRVLHMAKILQNKGFDKYQAMGIMEFMRPIKLPFIKK